MSKRTRRKEGKETSSSKYEDRKACFKIDKYFGGMEKEGYIFINGKWIHMEIICRKMGELFVHADNGGWYYIPTTLVLSASEYKKATEDFEKEAFLKKRNLQKLSSSSQHIVLWKRDQTF